MKNTRGVVIGGAAVIVTTIFFVVPFVFVLLIASKDKVESALLEFSWPTNFVLFDNIAEALAARDYLMVIAFINSVISFLIVAFAVFLLVQAYNRMREQPQPAAATEKNCPFCQMPVPIEAIRCGHCTSALDKAA